MTHPKSSQPPAQNPGVPAEDWLELVRQRVAGLQFGSVQITVHQGRVTQIESIERTRLAGDRAQPA